MYDHRSWNVSIVIMCGFIISNIDLFHISNIFRGFMIMTRTVLTKEELKKAQDEKVDKIIVKGDLAKQLKKASVIKKCRL